jgi:hypothetical protein
MKKTIELSLEQAREWYNDPEGFKKTLIANFSKEELEKKQLPKSWEELQNITGWFVNSYAGIEKSSLFTEDTYESDKNIFATQKQAESALAKAQLSQLMKAYSENSIEIDWNNTSQKKYSIRRHKNELIIDFNYNYYNFLSFPTAELRDEFFKNFQDLIKTYYEL